MSCILNACRGIVDRKQELSEEIEDTLCEMGIDSISSLVEIPGKSLHPHMIWNSAYTDGELLIFFNVSSKDRAKFLYYMGAENEADLVSLWEGVAVYEGVSASRLDVENEEEEEGPEEVNERAYER